MNWWPSEALSFGVISRASGSTVPPGGNGTIKRTGLLGHALACSAANADGAIASTHATDAMKRNEIARMVLLRRRKWDQVQILSSTRNLNLTLFSTLA